MLYLYCLAPPQSVPPPNSFSGIEDAPVRVIRTHSLLAWVSETAQAPSVTPDNARLHDRVIREAMRSETPLPARFGQVFDNEAALRASISAHESALTSGLEKVRGAVEMTVRALLEVRSSSPTPAVSTGTEYLAQLKERQKADDDIVEKAKFLQWRISAVTAPFVLAEIMGKTVAASRSVSISHLVARAAVEEYRAKLRALRDGDASLDFLVSGPWAPYSFVGIPDE